jgi:hypothetical protein
MVWIVVLVALVALSVFGAHRLFSAVEVFRSVGRDRALPLGLMYLAAVVVGGHATDVAINIHQVSSRDLGLGSSDKSQAIAQVLSSHAASVAWQAGLLVAASVLLALRLGATARAAQRASV